PRAAPRRPIDHERGVRVHDGATVVIEHRVARSEEPGLARADGQDAAPTVWRLLRLCAQGAGGDRGRAGERDADHTEDQMFAEPHGSPPFRADGGGTVQQGCHRRRGPSVGSLRLVEWWREMFTTPLWQDLQLSWEDADDADDDASLVERALALEPGERVLDAPCGTGRIAKRLRARGYPVVGLDATERFIREARHADLPVVRAD